MRGVPAPLPFLRACAPVFACAVLAFALAFGPALAQQTAQNRQLMVQNETDLALHFLYLFPPGQTDRGPDRLGSEVVAPGTTARVRLGRQSVCVFDVIAVWQDGREEPRGAFNICRNQRLIFGDPAMPTLEAAVANRSEMVLREFYAAPNSAEGWGPDRLGTEVVEPGEGFRLRIRTRACVFDLRAVYADDLEEVKPAFDLCAERGVVFDRSGIPRPSHSLVLANRHRAAVQEAYAAASNDGDWGPDRLAATGPLAVGEETELEVRGDCVVDLRIVFPNGGAEERREVDVCATPRILLTPGWVVGEQAPAMSAAESAPVAAQLTLRNAGTLPIVELYAAPPGEPRGADRLGADVLGVGETLALDLPDGDACRADLVAVFRDGREVTRPGVDLCEEQEIALP
ncbi:hypothetical protein ACVFYP_07805 [Roseomonas sp. F4]